MFIAKTLRDYFSISHIGTSSVQIISEKLESKFVNFGGLSKHFLDPVCNI